MTYPVQLHDLLPPPGWTYDQLLDFLHKVIERLELSSRGAGYKSYEAMDAWRLLDQVLRLPPYDFPQAEMTEGSRGPTIPRKGAFHRWLTATFHPTHPLWRWLPPGHRPTE